MIKPAALGRRQAEVLLVILTIIWGLSFPISRMLLQHNGVMTLLFVRFSIATIVTIAIKPRAVATLTRKQIYAGLTLGLVLALSFYLQTLGLKFTTSARGAFLTALYVIFVPFVAYPFLGEKPNQNVFAALVAALIGVVVLSYDSQSAAAIVGVSLQNLSLGDFLVFGSSILFAFHIVLVTKFSNLLPSFAGGILQMAVVAIGAGVSCILLHEPFLPYAPDWPLLLVFSVIGTSLVLVMQIVAQRATTATSAGIIYSLEPVVATIFGWVLLSEPVTLKTMISAAFFFLAVVLTILKR